MPYGTESLGWLKSEIDGAISLARIALQSYQDNHEMDSLRPVATHLHQVVGSLQMMELDGAASLAREAEMFVDDMATQTIDSETGDIVLLTTAFNHLTEHIEAISSGKPDVITRYLDFLNQLRDQRGKDKIDSFDLFHPDLEIYPPRNTGARLQDSEVAELATKLRRRYLNSLLVWLRNPGQSAPLQAINDIFKQFHNFARFGKTSQLWWISEGFTEALELQGDDISSDDKLILARLDQQIRLLIDNGEAVLVQNPQDDLLRKMLFVVGQQVQANGAIKMLRSTFSLDSLLDKSTVTSPEAKLFDIRQLSSRFSVLVESAQQALARYSESEFADQQSRLVLVEQLDQINQIAVDVGLTQIADVVVVLEKTVATLIASGEDSDATALIMAEALVWIQDSLDGETLVNSEWQHEADRLVARLSGRRDEDSEHLKATSHLTDTGLSTRDFAHLLLAISDEMEANLDQVEHALEAYSREPKFTSLLEPVPEQLVQIQGAMLILGQQRAAECLLMAEKGFTALRDNETDPIPVLIDALAVAVGAIGQYLQALKRGVRRYQVLDLAIGDLEAATQHGYHVDDPDGVIDNLQKHYQQWRKTPTAIDVYQATRHDLRTIIQMAEQSNIESVPQLAQEMSNLLEIISEDPSYLSDEVEQTLEASLLQLVSLMQTGIEVARSELTTKQDADDAHDPEILEVFFNEATAIQAGLVKKLSNWQDNNRQDKSLMKNIRRQFHTLKGSGRLAACGAIAELSWTIENLLNHVLDDKMPANDEVVRFTQDANAVLNKLVQERYVANEHPEQEKWATASAEILSEASAGDIKQVAEQKKPDLLKDETLVRIYIQETAGYIEQLEKLKDNHDMHGAELIDQDLIRVVHSMRGSSRSLHLTELADACAAAEQGFEHRHTLSEDDIQRLGRLSVLTQAFLQQLTETHEFPDAMRQQYRELENEFAQSSNTEQDSITEDITTQEPAIIEISQPVTVSESDNILFTDQDWETSDLTIEDLTPGDPSPGSVPIPDTVIAELSIKPEVNDHTHGLELDLTHELTDIFCEEAFEVLERMNNSISAAVTEGMDQHHTESIKRDLHTLKGSARTAGIMTMGDLAHETESLLDTVSDEQADSGNILDLLEEVHDQLVVMAESVARQEEIGVSTPLLQRIRNFSDDTTASPDQSGQENQDPISQGEKQSAKQQDGEANPQAPSLKVIKPLTGMNLEQGEGEAPIQRPRLNPDILDKLADFAGETAVGRRRMQNELVDLRSSMTRLNGTVNQFSDQLRELDIETESRISAREHPSVESDFDPLELDRFTRLQQISRGLAESLHELTDVQQDLTGFTSSAESVVQRQSQIDEGLREQVSRVRMMPFSTLVPRMRHLLRQTSRDLDKQVDLHVEGGDTSVDREVLERLGEALDHMIRNAVDHGIEDEESRLKADKTPVGRIDIRVKRVGREVEIDFRDDGRGFDVDTIRAQAIEQGLINESNNLLEDDLLRLIVVSGFSTAENLSQISGRGVGMDVANNVVRRLGGNLSVSSEPGQGVRFLIRVPTSLLISQAFFVSIGGQEFAIPATAIIRALLVEPESIKTTAELHHDLLDVAGTEYSLVDLCQRLGYQHETQTSTRIPIILIRMGARDIAVRVDRLLDTEEVVVKPLTYPLTHLRFLAGATLRGEGRVVLVLDLAELWLTDESAPIPAGQEKPALAVRTIMVVDDSLTVRKVTSRDLEHNGYLVTQAKDGIDALEQIAQQQPDLILIDIEMPRMDGYALTRELRSNPDTQELPIVMITSRSGDKHRKKALELGANDYITKPYQEAELISVVEHWLEKGVDKDNG